MDSLLERLPLVMARFIPFLMAIVFHEAAHAWMASRHGDLTARKMGRETLNPLPHLDPVGTVIFPLAAMLTAMPVLFGWAKPVPVNYSHLKPYRRGLFLVSIAGIAMNVLLATLSAFALVALSVSPEFYLTKPLIEMAKASIVINYSLAFFNLIPLPPLDGSKAIEAFLPLHLTIKFEKLQAYSFFILMGLLLTGALNVLAYPIMFFSDLSIRLWLWLFSALGMGVHFL